MLQVHAVSLRIGAVVEGIHALSVTQEEIEAGEVTDGRRLVDSAPQSVERVSRRLEMLQQQSEVHFTVVFALKAVPEFGQEMLYQTFARAVSVVAEQPSAVRKRVRVCQLARRTTTAADVSKSNAGADFASGQFKERRLVCRCWFLDNMGTVLFAVIPCDTPAVRIGLTRFVGNRERTQRRLDVGHP